VINDQRLRRSFRHLQRRFVDIDANDLSDKGQLLETPQKFPLGTTEIHLYNDRQELYFQVKLVWCSSQNSLLIFMKIVVNSLC
jgi:hypothetical protein